MQVFILIMVLLLLWHDQQSAAATGALLSGWRLAAAVLVPKLVLALSYAVLCRVAHRQLLRAWTLRWVARLDRLTLLYRLGVLGLWALDLHLGLMPALRRTISDLILIDELAAMTLTLAMIVFGWWAYYPIDRHLREATLMRRLDSGEPVHAIWTRRQYLLEHLRHQMLLILVPLLVLLAWLEAIYRWAPPEAVALQAGLTLGGAATVFLFAPVVIRRLWDTTPLAAGALRSMLVDMCKQHRVRVRELLLWRTFGGLINAAVMGFVGPLRYILLTDALLERLPLKQVEAIMAHELAHVRRHHMFWLLTVAMGTSGLLQTVGMAAAWLLPAAAPAEAVPVVAGFSVDLLSAVHLISAVAVVAGAICWLLVFGCVSRRFERQADVFAVQHLVRQRAAAQGATDADAPTVDAQSVRTMVSALENVAQFNHMPTTRRSWRHGSIARRQAYLNSLIGQDVDKLPIDRQVLWIKLASAALLAALIALLVLAPSGQAA